MKKKYQLVIVDHELLGENLIELMKFLADSWQILRIHDGYKKTYYLLEAIA